MTQLRIPTDRLVACVRRELHLRRQVYPRRIAAGAMSVNQARDEISCMEDILEVLEERMREERLL